MKKFKLKLLSKDGKLELSVEQLTLNCAEGYLTILANHIPLITTVKKGFIEYVNEGKRNKLEIEEGIMKVEKNEVIIFSSYKENK